MIKNKPVLSVLIPTWNRVDTVFKAAQSVDDFTDNVEIIVVDNASELEVFNSLEEKLSSIPNTRVYRNSKNVGMVKNWNKCISYAHGEWMSLLCSDDLYIDDAINRFFKIISDINEPYLIIQDSSIKDKLEKLPSGISTVKSLKLPIASGNFWHHEVIKKLGGFDERFEYSADAEFWPRVAYNFPVVKVKDHFAQYFLHNENYMWQTWGKDNFIDQCKLLIKTNLNYILERKERKKEVVENEINKGILQTIETIISHAFNENKKELLRKYIKIARKEFKNDNSREAILNDLIKKNKTIIKDKRIKKIKKRIYNFINYIKKSFL